MIYKKGKTVTSDIVEIDSVEIEDSNKPYVAISILRPKVRRPKSDSPSVEWEKEVIVKPSQVLFHSPLKTEIDFFDVDGYERMLSKVQSLESQYQ